MRYVLWVKGVTNTWMMSVNDPTIYPSLRKALAACEVQKKRMGALYTYRPRVLRTKKKVKK